MLADRENQVQERVLAEKFIAVAGNMGVGKTTLVEYITSRYPITPVYEPFQENPYLEPFYKDMKTWSFKSQIWFLSHKFRLHQDLQNNPNPLIQDRTIYEDAEIFATMLHKSRHMSKDDYNTYMELYRSMKRSLQPPDLLIYLRCGVRTIRKRIKQRGRPAEQEIPTRYLRNLNKLYEEWVAGFTAAPVLIWDTEKLDYLGDLVDRIEFNEAIEEILS
jgi:deoxyadenosine/deoxycytidine kinase